MTIQTTTTFDAEGYARAFDDLGHRDVAEHYADDVELTMVTPDNPPGRPLVIPWQGTAADDVGARGRPRVPASASVSRVVADDGAAFTFDCEFPGDHVVVSNVLVDLADGLIVRQHEVMVGAPG